MFHSEDIKISKLGEKILRLKAKKVKDISPELISGEINRIADNYIMYSGWFK